MWVTYSSDPKHTDSIETARRVLAYALNAAPTNPERKILLFDMTAGSKTSDPIPEPILQILQSENLPHNNPIRTQAISPADLLDAIRGVYLSPMAFFDTLFPSVTARHGALFPGVAESMNPEDAYGERSPSA